MSEYYNNNAHQFYETTVNVDMRLVYQRFLPKLPTHARILDAGCGSGRDTKAFYALGFQVTAFDASVELVKLARQYSQLPIQCCQFTEFKSDYLFDGIWACASLLHSAYADLGDNFNALAQHLKAAGIFYCSFKYGDAEVERDGRKFTNLTEKTLASVLEDTSLFIEEHWITGDLRAGRENEKWLNAILRKTP